jgi:hypothetical protein
VLCAKGRAASGTCSMRATSARLAINPLDAVMAVSPGPACGLRSGK